MLDTILNFDTRLLLTLQEYLQHQILNPLFIFITHLGDHGLIWIVFGLLLICFKRTRMTGVLLLISLLITHLLNTIVLKNLIMRPRPYLTNSEVIRLIGPQSESSFPSGHSASSFASATIPFKREKGILKYLPILLAFLIAFSRIYVGVHYPLDVIAGTLIGILIANLINWLFEKLSGKRSTSGAGNKKAAK